MSDMITDIIFCYRYVLWVCVFDAEGAVNGIVTIDRPKALNTL